MEAFLRAIRFSVDQPVDTLSFNLFFSYAVHSLKVGCYELFHLT